MSRVKRGTKARTRRNKILKLAKGFRGGQSKLFRTAIEKVHRALRFSYRDRRVKKRDFRSLWISRIGAATRLHGINYSRFIDGLKKANVALDRKVLSELAIKSPDTFAKIVELAKSKVAV